MNKSCNCDDCGYENVWGGLKLGKETLVIEDTYRHPKGKAERFVGDMETALQRLGSNTTHMILGDININLLNCENYHTSDYLMQLLAHNFIPKITLTTKIKDTSHDINWSEQKWITPALKMSIKHKDRLYRKKLNNPTDSNILKYKQYKNRLDAWVKEQRRCIIMKHFIRNQTQCYKCGSLWDIFLIRVEKQHHSTLTIYVMKTGKYTTNKT